MKIVQSKSFAHQIKRIMEYLSFARAGFEIIYCFFLRFIGASASFFIKRKGDVWLFYGRNGRFFDNTKYLALWISKHGNKNQKLLYVHAMRQPPNIPGIRFIQHNSWAELFALLTAGYIIVDDVDQLIRKRRVLFSKNAQLVQLWHGVFLKKRLELIAHDLRMQRLSHTKKFLLQFRSQALLRFPSYEIFVSTSKYYTDQVFSHAFKSHRFINCGYPRNDILLGSSELLKTARDMELTFSQLELLDLYHSRNRVVLYAPTFRLINEKEANLIPLSIGDLQEHANNRNCLWLVKPHPWDAVWQGVNDTENVRLLDGSFDIYPILNFVDVMVTDYSSICYDYLLLDRPIVFFPYDREKYIEQNDNLMFDYDEYTPGSKVYTKEELFQEVDYCFSDKPDQWIEARAQIRKLAFDNLEPTASKKIYLAMLHNYKIDYDANS